MLKDKKIKKEVLKIEVLNNIKLKYLIITTPFNLKLTSPIYFLKLFKIYQKGKYVIVEYDIEHILNQVHPFIELIKCENEELAKKVKDTIFDMFIKFNYKTSLSFINSDEMEDVDSEVIYFSNAAILASKFKDEVKEGKIKLIEDEKELDKYDRKILKVDIGRRRRKQSRHPKPRTFRKKKIKNFRRNKKLFRNRKKSNNNKKEMSNISR